MYRINIGLISFFLIFTVYFQLSEMYQYDTKRIIQLTLFLFIGFVTLFYLIKNFIEKNNSAQDKSISGSKFTVICFGILFATGLISVILASNLSYALLEFSFFFLILSMVYLITPTSLKQHYQLGKFIFATAVIYSSIYIVIFFGNYISSFFNPMIIIWPEKYNFTLTIDGIELTGKEVLYFDHNRFFNHTQTWTLPILLGLLTYYQGIKNNKQIVLTLIFLISCWWMLIFASGGRGSIMGITVALFLLLIICNKDAFQLLKNGIITFFLGGIFYFIFFRFMISDSRGIPFLRDTDSGRFGMWEKAMEMWMQNPFFGVGPLHYAKITVEPYFAHPHNFYLQILSEWGLIGFITFAILGFILVKMIYQNYFNRERNTANQTVNLAFTWSILAAFIHAFFSGVMHTPMSQMWFVLMLAWLLGFQRYNFTSNKLRFNKNYIHIVYIVLLIILCWIVRDDILPFASGYSEYFSKYPESELNPRFWIQGLFE